MKINLNKDFEEQYKNELWKGFTARELGYGVVALLVAGGVAFSVWKATGLAINLSIYAGIPFMVPIIYLAMVKHQGHTWIESLKNMWFYMQTKELPCEMEERNVSQHRIFLWIQNVSMSQRKKELQGGRNKCQSLTETVCFCQKKAKQCR